MTDRRGVTVVRRPGRAPSAQDGPAGLPAACQPRTRAGKGEAVAAVVESRADAIALYERFGFTLTEPWDERDQPVRMERAVS
ncbi:hypothetical protein PUR34_36885 [Streptomyces sp. JV185]|uniref:hypothetical protein n=1 Tax=Streptomyces sp. JV185 TaxID=858638 RepID=UPI002E772A0D|nr:hypothetical protein [Streptomyces sp. JV185]MEE1773597.1 hypothetical protein [Streptomyces sp. JV185]